MHPEQKDSERSYLKGSPRYTGQMLTIEAGEVVTPARARYKETKQPSSGKAGQAAQTPAITEGFNTI